MNIFESAARKKLRFSSNKGELTAEQLFDLTAEELDVIARPVMAGIKSFTTESLIPTKPNPKLPALELKLDVIKHIVAFKLEEKEADKRKAERKIKRDKLVDAMVQQQDAELQKLPVEELRKRLEELDNEE